MADILDTPTAVAASTHTFSVSAGTNRCLIVGLTGEGSQTGDHTCTYGGQTMQHVVAAIAGSGTTQQTVTLFYLNDSGIVAASGTTITPGNVPGDLSIHAASYENVSQSTPTNTDTDSSAAATPNPLAALDIVTGAANAVVCALSGMGNAGSCAWASPLTERTDQATASANGSYADDEVPTATTIACEPTWTTQNRAAGAALELAHLSSAGITGIVPTEFDMDAGDVDIDGSNFEASQGTGTVYISDANTLAGSVNEVEIANGINTWSDTQINLDLTGLNATERDNLNTLGPGARYIIVVNDSSDEYGSTVITLHRAHAFVMSASSNITDTGENTTAQLTAPATKTTGDFAGGRITDLENPDNTTVNVTADNYREDEWCFQATTLSREVQYQFRVTIAGVAIETYTVDPRWTVTSALEVTGAHIASGAALNAPTVVPGAVAVTGAHIATGAALNVPSVAHSVAAPHIASSATLNAPTVDVGAVSVTGAHIASGAVLNAPTVDAGAVTVTGEHIASGAALSAPTVDVGAVAVTTAHIASGVSLSASTVAPGAVTVTGAHVASGVSLSAPTIDVGAVSVTMAHISATSSLSAPTVLLGIPVVGAHISSGVSLSAPTIDVGAVSVTTAHIAAGAALNAPVVSLAGAQEVTGSHIASGATLSAPTLTPGAVAVTSAHISTTATLSAPTVMPQAVAVVAAHIASGVVLSPPTVTTGAVAVTGTHISSTLSLSAPTVAQGLLIGGVHISSTVALFGPTLAAGAVSVTSAHIASGASFYPPNCTFVVDGAHIASTAALSAPSPSYVVDTAHIATTATLNPPTAVPGAVAITSAHITSGAALASPAIVYNVAPQAIASTTVLNAPSVTVGAVTVLGAHIGASPIQCFALTVIGGTLYQPQAQPGASEFGTSIADSATSAYIADSETKTEIP